MKREHVGMSIQEMEHKTKSTCILQQRTTTKDYDKERRVGTKDYNKEQHVGMKEYEKNSMHEPNNTRRACRN